MNDNENNNLESGYGSQVRNEGNEGEELQQPLPSSDHELHEADEPSETVNGDEASAEVEEGTGKPIFGPEVIHDVEGALSGDYLPAPRPKRGRPKGRKDAMKFSKRGRPGHEPNEVTRQTVLMHVAVGTTVTDIAKLLGIGLKTLKKHYKEELNFGRSKANASVAGKLFDRAMNGDVTAQIFWLKAQANWSDKQQVEFSSEDGTSPVNRVEIEVIGEDGPKKKQIGHESEHSSDSTTS